MEDVKKRLLQLQTEAHKASRQLRIDELDTELKQLRKASEAADFWSDNLAAQDTMRKQGKIQTRIEPWQSLSRDINDTLEMLALDDETMGAELAKQTTQLEQRFAALKDELKLSGPYDDHSAILGIYAGAGGTDAQDWAGMLLRMYLRWAAASGFKANVIEESAGEEAGIKSAVVEIDGNYAYGKLKGEHGVHRLVRLSPFNADNLRQTSFAKVEILPEIDSPDDVDIDEKDLKIDVYRAGGHGGQSVNTTDSAVRITHVPTNIVVAIQNERSQLQNKETAMTILRSRLAQLQIEQHQEKVAGLKGPNQSAEWGNQIRSYVVHPYKQVKDLRTGHESKEPDKILDGNIDDFIEAYLEQNLTS